MEEMNNQNDFIIENGILKEYSGNNDVVTVPEEVVAIGVNAFRNRKNLRQIYIPNSVREICKQAFEGCSNLQQIAIPASVERIGGAAFLNCGLERITLSNGIKEILGYMYGGAFEGCAKLHHIDIPDSVKKIDKYVFSNSGIEEISLPNSIKEIESFTFYRCQNLRRVIIPNSVKKIDSWAFADCSNLREIMIPTSVEKIEGGAFRNSGLEKIILPNSIRVIEEGVFNGCKNLRHIGIPDSIEEIREYAFRNSGLEEISIPNNVRTIGEWAFSNCLNLTKLTVLSEKCKGTSVFEGCKSLKYITGNISGFISKSFSGCPRELSYFVCIRNKAKQINAVIDWLCGDRMEIDDVDAIFDFARKNRMNILATLVERENVKAFVELLKIPDIGLTYKDVDYALQCAKADSQIANVIREYNEQNCAEQEKAEDVSSDQAVLSADVKEIFKLIKNNGEYTIKSVNSIKKTIIIPEKIDGMCVTRIENNAFSKCKDVERVVIPKTIKSIGETAFVGCPDFKAVHYGGDIKSWCDISFGTQFENPLWYAHNLYIDNQLVTTMVVPDGVETIKPFAFAGATCLESVVCSDSVSSISEGAFYNCSNLTSVTIGRGLQYIGDSAFLYCSLLKYVVMSNDNVGVQDYAFFGCDSLPIQRCDGATQNVRRLEEKYIDKNAQRATIEDVYFKNSHLPCSGGLWNELITEASIKEVVLSEKANEILEVLDENSVNEYLEKVVEKIPSQEQITFARLANDESIEWSIQLISSRRRDTHPQRLWAERMLDALYYSNTQTAKDYIVKKGDLEKYAKMRGYCEQEYRDLVILPDFGFDKNGVREFVAGGKDYQASISSDFKMNIVEVATGKTVRKLPTKTEEDAQVADCVAKLKKDVEEFYELRKQYWRRIFIQGETISEKVFNQAYLSKPIFAPIVSSLIWESKSGTFFEVNDGVAEKLDGSQYVISEPVKIAHFLDMTDNQREQWREKIEKENKTLIAEQLPLFVGEMDEFKDVVNRYKDLELTEDARTKMRKTLQNYSVKIESVVEYSYDYDFDRREYFDDGVMKFGKYFSLTYKIKKAHELFVLGDMKCDIEDTDSVKREMYLILRALDDAVIRSAISRNANMTSMEKYLSNATYEQIQEYIDYATAQDNPGFVAVLLEYRNKKYGDREVFDQFLI